MAQSNMSDVTIHKNMLQRRQEIEVGKINMFTVGVVMLSYLAGKALICRDMFCEWVPFCLLSMTTGACSQHIRYRLDKRCQIIATIYGNGANSNYGIMG